MTTTTTTTAPQMRTAPSPRVVRRLPRSVRAMRLIRNLAAIALILVAGALVERLVWWNKVLPGVKVAGANVRGDNESQARAAIEEATQRLETTPIRATARDQELSVIPADLEYEINIDASVRAARRAGRKGNPIEQVTGAVLRRLRDDNVQLVHSYSSERVEQTLDGWSAQIGEGLVNGDLKFEGTTVIAIPPQRGTGIKREEAGKMLIDAIENGDRSTLRLPVGTVDPDVNRSDVEQAAQQARNLLTSPFTVNMANGTFTISPEQLAMSLGTEVKDRNLALQIDTDELRRTLSSALSPFEIVATEATFAVSGSGVSVVPSTPGKQVDLDAIASEILTGKRTITGNVKEYEPRRNTAWAQSLNITEPVSSFTTNHPAGQERVKNIHRAADLINNTVVEPGGIFSLNGAIGKRTPERGFVKAPSYSTEDGFFEDYGGGVSQLSTTIFNAVWFGGYKDVAHTPHSIYISRYPMGREATLNYGSIDLKFRNDSRSGILIRTSYTDSSITVAFYGNKEGRSVRTEGPNILERKPIETEYIDDPSLPPGTEKESEKGYEGIRVENFRIISRPGQDDKKERYVWTYDMIPRKVRRGVAPTAPPPASVSPPASAPAR